MRFNPREVNNVVTYETVLSVDNRRSVAAAGHDRDGRDPRSRKKDSALLVPNRALRFLPPAAAPDRSTVERHERPRVWVVRDGAAVAVPVATGLTNGELTEVTSGDVATRHCGIVDIERPARQQQQGGGPFG